jgi:hypothetical protein
MSLGACGCQLRIGARRVRAGPQLRVHQRVDRAREGGGAVDARLRRAHRFLRGQERHATVGRCRRFEAGALHRCL